MKNLDHQTVRRKNRKNRFIVFGENIDFVILFMVQYNDNLYAFDFPAKIHIFLKGYNKYATE